MKKIIFVALMAVCLFTSCSKESDSFNRIEPHCASGKAVKGDIYISVEQSDPSVQLHLRIAGLDDLFNGKVITGDISSIRFNGIACTYTSGEVKVVKTALNFFTLEFIDFMFINYLGEEFRCNMMVTVAK